MLVGEAPGAEEDKAGRPFIGRAGQILNSCLAGADLDRSDLYTTNIVKCRPNLNRTPTEAEVAACRLYLVRELNTVKPKVIVALGGAAAQALTGNKKVGESRGRLLAMRPEFRSDIKVVVTYHPASQLYTPNAENTKKIIADLRFATKALRQNDGTAARTPVRTGNGPEVRAGLEQLKSARLLAVDCEWEVLEHKGGRPWTRRKGKAPELLSIALSGEVSGEIITVACPVDNQLASQLALELVTTVPTVYHNAPADAPWLISVGCPPKLIGDTLLLASLLNLETSLSLGVLAGMLTEMPPGWKAAVTEVDGPRKSKKKTLLGRQPVTDIEWDILLEANGSDALATLMLHKRLLAMVKETGRKAVIPLYKELLKASMALIEAAVAGIPIDRGLLAQLDKACVNRIEGCTARIRDTLGVDVGRKDELAWALHRRLDEALPMQPKRNVPSIRRVNLSLFADDPVVSDCIKLSRFMKLRTTYTRPWKYLLDEQEDNRLHTDYKLWVARSGRSSAEIEMGGTLQQFPRGAQVRKLVRARPGYQIVSADLSQIELRLAAWLAGEDRMIEAYRKGEDLHKLTAGFVKVLGQLTLEEYLVNKDAHLARVTALERQNAKPVNFGFLYGMRERTFIETARKDYGAVFTMEQATLSRGGYFTLYPKLIPWHAAALKWVKLGYVDTLLGRRRKLIADRGEDEGELHRQAINMGPQATGSDLALIALADIRHRLRLTRLDRYAVIIGFIHDAILLEVKDEALAEVCQIVKWSMEHPNLEPFKVELPVPLVADLKVSPVWA